MEVHLTREQESQLSQLAQQTGRATDAFAQEAVSRFLEEEARFTAAVKSGEAQLERGEFVTHAEVGERLGRLFRS